MFLNPELTLARDRQRNMIADAQSARILSAARRHHRAPGGKVAERDIGAGRVDSGPWHRQLSGIAGTGQQQSPRYPAAATLVPPAVTLASAIGAPPVP